MAVKTLASFCILFGEQFPKLATCTILSFIEFLSDNALAPATIRNYVCSVKAVFKRLSIDVNNFESHLVKLALRSLDKNAKVRYKPKPILSIENISQLLYNMNTHPMYVFFAVAILFAFMGMLRISNVTCASFKKFDPLRHIARGDVQPSEQGLVITIKWSKTLQSYRQGAVVHLPSIPHSPLCPVAVFNLLNSKFPVPNNLPLLSYLAGSTYRVISKNSLQAMLKSAAAQANIPFDTSFHIFCRSAASLAFAAGVPFKQIQAHGTWTSESIWSYIHSSAKAALLPNFFRQAISKSTSPLGLGFTSLK
jgi:integrase